jgi:hypothetical protein
MRGAIIMHKVAKLTLVLFVFVFLGMQFVTTAAMSKTSTTNKDPHMREVINPQVGAILDRACQDCHSSRTKWPWYSHVAPISWIVYKDVSEGRENLNFSEWTSQPDLTYERMMICNAVSSGEMPLPEYTAMHRSAKLSKQDVELICRWAAAASTAKTSRQAGKSTNQEN